VKPPLAIRPLLILAAAKIALHLVAIEQYGYFRDELYYLASTDHLDWGYVDHPPLSIALLKVVRALLGRLAARAPPVPALAGVATVILFGVVARQLGADAMVLAALAALLCPVFLGGPLLLMNALPAAGTIVASLASTAAQRQALIALGVVLGLALLNKVSALWLGGARDRPLPRRTGACSAPAGRGSPPPSPRCSSSPTCSGRSATAGRRWSSCGTPPPTRWWTSHRGGSSSGSSGP
jgi:hypothetical protein